MASDSLSEQEIQFRKRARRRLVGAVALVLLMVTLLPMVLDDQEPAPPQQEIAISIPSQDGADFASKVVPAPAIPANESVPTAAPAIEMASPIKPPPPVKSAPAQTAPVPKAQENKPAPAKQQPASEAVAQETPVASVPVSKETVVAEPAAKESAQIKTAEASAPGKTGFSVQIGVYSDAAKVKQLQSKLKAQGIATYTEKLGDKIRLRSGPYKTRDSAEKVQAKLKQINMSSMVVTNK